MKKNNNIYCIIGDGESQEGSIWEAALFGAQHKIDNLICITDYNKKQASGLIKDILNLDKLKSKWEAFGWETIQINGHCFNEIISNLKLLKESTGKPKMLICDTIKGKGNIFFRKSR